MTERKKTISELRNEKGYTQFEMAQKVGVALSTYTKWELDSISLGEAKARNVLKLAQVLGVSVNDLL